MRVNHMLSLSELDAETFAYLIGRGLVIARARTQVERRLAHKVVGIYFRGPSTRTRTAFTVGAMRLGASTIAYGPHDLQLTTGETVEDTARVMSGFLDALVIRTNDSMDEMRAFADQDTMAVINAMSEAEHPTQAIGDFVTLHEEFGRLDGLHLLYVGEGNNTASSLAFAAGLTPGFTLTLVTPDGYGLPDQILQRARSLARENGACVDQFHGLDNLPRAVDAVYATRWQTMGVPKSEANWKEKFEAYRVTAEMMLYVSKPSGTIFLHDLPAVRGGDVVDEVLDGPQSRAFRQAQHKLTGSMAVLDWCLNGMDAVQSIDAEPAHRREREHHARLSGFAFRLPH